MSDQVPTCPGCAYGEARGYARGIEAAAKWLEDNVSWTTSPALLPALFRHALIPTPSPQAAEAPGRHAGDPWNPPRPAPPAAPAGEGPVADDLTPAWCYECGVEGTCVRCREVGRP